MKIGVLSDAHGNELGFYPCYNYLKKHVDIIYYLGDVVGYFPLSNKIIETLKTDRVTCLKGNHDAMLLQELKYDSNREDIYQIAKSRRAITEENIQFLKGLKPEKMEYVDNRKLLFVHGSPSDPLNGYIYPDTKVSFEKLRYNVVFMGHTHRSFIKRIDGSFLVNVGSCGLPRDSGNKLTVAVYDTLTNEVEIKDLELNVKSVINAYALHSTVKDVLTRNNKDFNHE